MLVNTGKYFGLRERLRRGEANHSGLESSISNRDVGARLKFGAFENAVLSA
jgi:hypothetical protein